MKKLFNLILLFLFSHSSFANASHYWLVIDANQSGSVLHLYSYQKINTRLPDIHEIMTEQNTSPLSNYMDNPENAGQSLKKLLDDAQNELNKQGIATRSVSISVFGTDGMRLLPKSKQQILYRAIKNYLQSHYDFTVQSVAMLPGKMQGVFDWLDVNYLTGNLISGNPIAILEVGDDSLQVAFLKKEDAEKTDRITVTIHHQDYPIFSKHFSRLGEDQAILKMNADKNHGVCYQTNAFQFSSCATLFQSVINLSQIDKKILPIEANSIAVLHRAQATYEFFGVEDNSESALVSRINEVCSLTWDEMKAEYADSGMPVEKLWTMCAEGVYLDQLFYQTLHLNASTLWVTDKTHHGQKIDWTLGFVLYIIQNSN